MSALPVDLKPLPTAPYDERPESLPLDVEECRTALWRCEGNITKAAKLIKVPSARLRAFIKNSTYLSAEMVEAKEQILDAAEGNVLEALSDPDDTGRRDAMSKFVLTNLGEQRGYGKQNGKAAANFNFKGGKFSISWEGEGFEEPGKVIEHGS